MRQNRVRELRKAQGMTVRDLAEKAGLSHTYVVRIESGERGLSVAMAEKLANALSVAPTDVLGLGDPSSAPHSAGLAEDAVPYEVGPTTPISIKASARNNVVPFEVKTTVLDALDYRPGDVVLVDISQDAVDRLASQKCVVVQLYDGMRATTLLRQFITPQLLITNSRGRNEMPLRLDADDVAIKGVIVGSLRLQQG